MNSKKVSRKETKKKVHEKIEAALKEFKINSKDKKYSKKIKEASNLLADFIIHHRKAASAKPAAVKAKTKKKSSPGKAAKVKTA
jgi:hypothetical protein